MPNTIGNPTAKIMRRYITRRPPITYAPTRKILIRWRATYGLQA
jgi:hypothetical protein